MLYAIEEEEINLTCFTDWEGVIIASQAVRAAGREGQGQGFQDTLELSE